MAHTCAADAAHSPSPRSPWITCGLTVTFATLILGFGQTGFSLQSESVITFLSLFLSLTALTMVLNVGRVYAAKRYLRTPGRLTPMPGALMTAIHDWKRRVWACVYLVAAAAFILIVAPTGDSWQESRTPLLTWLGIVGGFAVIALSAWAVFRLVPKHVAVAPPQEQDKVDA